MKVFISVDMEGLGGVATWAQVEPGSDLYPQTCRWMTEQVNACVEGAVAAGAKTIVVKDAHDRALNIDWSELHSAAELISGWGPMGGMVEGIDESFDALFLLGYHSRVGTIDGTLAHTWTRRVLDLRIDGQSVGESFLASGYAGQFGVPTALVIGDDKLIGQLTDEWSGSYQTVVTKTALGHESARMKPREQLYAELREQSRLALNDLSKLSVHRTSTPMEVALRLRPWEKLSEISAWPGMTRVSEDTLQFTADDFTDLHARFIAIQQLVR